MSRSESPDRDGLNSRLPVVRFHELPKRCFLSVVLLVLLGAAAVSAREVKLVILNTTDVHGHILPADDAEGHSVGGLLRDASAIQEIRSQEKNVILVDCGDLIQGTAESWLTRGEIMLRALKWLHYDAWVVGNHDLDWGVQTLARLQEHCPCPLLAGNILGTSSSNSLSGLKPFVIKEIDGVRVAIIGLTTPGVPLWLRPDYLGDLRFEKSKDALARIMRSVRAEQPDVIILLAHQGYEPMVDDTANEIHEIARWFPEVDVILGGHLHKALPSVRLNGVLYSQAGCYGNWLGRIDITVDTEQKRVVNKTATLIEIGDRYPICRELQGLLKDDLEKSKKYLAEEVGSASQTLTSTLTLPAQSGVQQLICRAIQESTKAEVVLHGILAEATLDSGPLRRRDIWRIVPYENRIGVASLTMQEIKDILEENFQQVGSVHFLGVYGLSYELHPNAARGQRIQNLALADGSRPKPDERLRVAASSYVLASGGGRFAVFRKLAEQPEAQLLMTDVDTRSAVTDYVRKHSPLCIAEDHSVTVVRGGESRKSRTPESRDRPGVVKP